MRTATHRKSRRFGFESLERREVLSGLIGTTFSNGTLTITGDGMANHLAITSGVNTNQITLSGGTDTGTNQGRTQINGKFGDASFNGVTNIVLNLQGGDDVVVVSNLNLNGNLQLNLGGGNDTVFIQGITPANNQIDLNGSTDLQYGAIQIRGNVTIDGGAGNDAVTLVQAKLNGSLTFTGGAGNDHIVAYGPMGTNNITGDVKLDLGDGDDSVQLKHITIGGNLTITDTSAVSGANVELTNLKVTGNVGIDLSSQNDTLTILGEFGANNEFTAGSVRINTYAGNDSVTVRTAKLQSLVINAGAGADNVVVAGTRVNQSLNVNTGLGRDSVTIRNTITSSLNVNALNSQLGANILLNAVQATNATVNTGSGVDSIRVLDSLFTNLQIDTGDGDDRIELDAIIRDRLQAS